MWSDGEDSFATGPPNAALVLDDGSCAVIELKTFTLDGETISYEVEMLAGEVPASGSGTLMIGIYK